MEINSKIAELMGIIVGDGNITLKQGIKYRLIITGHSIDDKNYLTTYVSDLLYKLFKKKPTIWKHKNKNAIALAFHSKEIISYFVKDLGLVNGPKKDLKIPQLILESNKKIKSSFLRGFADTDFSVTFKKKQRKTHSYPVIHGYTNSLNLAKQIKKMLFEFDIKSNIYEKKMFLNGLKIGYQLDVYGRNNFSNWLTKIGFKNEKHTSKISIWRKHGHYLPKNR
ncbi:MAG: hypothetical protein CMH64_00880 [Nanoarchaeota archaeon]|nr:hypothetical protein [Nanoarchaeota archaeon]|tara:strand:- start:356 stop:1024 length:669 start_codon:yes stop_codon:yes gene_type:complete